jgi:hypothetical protein
MTSNSTAESGAGPEPKPPPQTDQRSASADPLAEVRATLAQIRDAGADYLDTALDALRAAARRALLLLILLLAGGLCAATVLIVSLILVFIGGARLLSDGLGVSSAAGYFILGTATLGVLGGSVAAYLVVSSRKRLAKAKAKYAQSRSHSV